MQVKNSAGEDTRENVYVSSAEEHEIAGSRGTAHFVNLRWDRSQRNQANMSVVDVKGVTRPYTSERRRAHATVPLCRRHAGICSFGAHVPRARGGMFKDACVPADEDDGKWVPIIGFECRGIEPIDWRPEVGGGSRAWCLRDFAREKHIGLGRMERIDDLQCMDARFAASRR